VRVTARVDPDPQARGAWDARVVRQRALHDALRAWRTGAPG
jgi:hypothetical protein